MATLGHNSKNYTNPNSMSKADRKRLKNAIVELNDSMQRAAAERDFQKEALDDVAEELGLDKKIIKRMARTYFKATYNKDQEEYNTFKDFYELVINATEEAAVSVKDDSLEDLE